MCFVTCCICVPIWDDGQSASRIDQTRLNQVLRKPHRQARGLQHMVGLGRWEARTFAGACIVAGLALGFVLVGLVTEPLEGAVGFPALPLVKTLLLVLAA